MGIINLVNFMNLKSVGYVFVFVGLLNNWFDIVWDLECHENSLYIFYVKIYFICLLKCAIFCVVFLQRLEGYIEIADGLFQLPIKDSYRSILNTNIKTYRIINFNNFCQKSANLQD